MFWEKWIPNKYLVKSSVCGLEIILSDSGFTFNYCILKNQSGKLKLIDSGSFKNIEDIPSVIKKNKIPINIVLSGSGIILKPISVSEKEVINLEILISQNFPTLNIEEFIIQHHPQTETLGYLALIRKENAKTIVDKLIALKYQVSDLIIGPCFLNLVPPITNNFDSINTASYSIEFENSNISTVTNNILSQNNFDLDGINVSSTNILSFSAAFIYLIQIRGFVDYNNEINLRRSHLEVIKLKILAYSCVCFIFLVCMVNFFLYTNSFEKHNKVETELTIYQSKFDHVSKLFEDYEKKKNLIEHAGILNSTLIAKQADKIASTVPEEVVLCDWQFNPILKSIDEDSLTRFEKNTIIIKGNCNKSLIINEWVNILKTQNFIADINLETFHFNKEGHLPNFELKIITN